MSTFDPNTAIAAVVLVALVLLYLRRALKVIGALIKVSFVCGAAVGVTFTVLAAGLV